MYGRALSWLVVALVCAGAALALAEDRARFVSIGTGGQTGVYHAVGQAICAYLHNGQQVHGIQCKAPASGGGIANVNGLRNGEFDFGLMQVDHLHKARNGLPPFEGEAAAQDIRALFSLQQEVFTVLARRDAAITSFDDLRGKRVNVGNAGSGQRDTLERILAAKGWDLGAFALASELKPAEQASAMGENNIDAMTYFVGHPNAAIEEATSVVDAVLVPVSDAVIDAFVAQHGYYRHAQIPAGLYRGSDEPTPSIGVRAVAAALASADAEVVYQTVRTVFENLEALRQAHPALAELDEVAMITFDADDIELHEGALRYYRERGWR